METFPRWREIMSIKIEKGVALPDEGGARAWPIPNMEPGDSFAFPDNKKTAVRSAASYYGSKMGAKFSIRTLPNGESRIWRVS